MSNKFTKKQAQFIQAARSVYGNEVDRLSRNTILDICKQFGLNEPQWLIKSTNRVPDSRGIYYLPFLDKPAAVKPQAVNKTQVPNDSTMEMARSAAPVAEDAAQTKPEKKGTVKKLEEVLESMIPARDKNFVRFGIYQDLKVIVNSGIFYPVFISGLSGNGKSFTPEQICAELKREFYRVNIQKNTNEDDLLGGFRLINGETVWEDGPVVRAAEKGAILLLDEVDYGSAEITCLQNVLEGKPFLLKKINRMVYPKAGFNIIATANTKGQGDSNGKFVFTNVLNEAFLERFSVTLEQDYPPASVETKILVNNFKSLGMEDAVVGDFAEKLVKWANTNRETYKKGAFNEVLSTRRLVHIAKAYSMFKNRLKAVEICLNRFDTESKSALYDLYQKIDAVPVSNDVTGNAVKADPLAPDADGGVVF
jgi:hypothetical protein